MKDRQLKLDFTATAVREIPPSSDATATDPESIVISKDEFKRRIRAIWHAVEGWLLDCTPATEFAAYIYGVADKIEPEWTGSFSDAAQVNALRDEWQLVGGLAFAVEEAAMLMAEHGHPENAETLVRSYYLAVALNTLGYDLEHYLPGIPVHALGR